VGCEIKKNLVFVGSAPHLGGADKGKIRISSAIKFLV
jgi:hypothetical protein